MTKFSDEFMNNVKQYWEKNKNTINGKKQGGVHRKVNIDRKFTMDDLAEHFNLTGGQAKRIVYIKKGDNK